MISDFNTTGLYGEEDSEIDPYFKFFKSQNLSTYSEMSAGTYGEGKNAFINFSTLRAITVYSKHIQPINGKEDLYNTPWLSSIKEWQNEKLNARDFVDSVRSELLGKRVFVFLRNGKILNLARGATAVDAAFQIHTEVGLNMHGVEINGRPVRKLSSSLHFISYQALF